MIDRWITEQVKQDASELHLSVGQPPLLFVQNQMRKLEAKTLEPADTMSAMKSITPERNQQEFYETKSTEFSFAFGDQARLRVMVYRVQGQVALQLDLLRE